MPRRARVDPPLAFDLEPDGAIQPERSLVLRLDGEREVAGAVALERGEGVQKQRAAEPVPAFGRGDRERVDPAAPAGQDPTGHPAHGTPVAAGEEHERTAARHLPPSLE